MAASDAAASLNPASTLANGATADAGVSPFEPSVWGDFFANYTNPISKESQKQMRERAQQLQGEVRRMFEGKSTADLVTLVDTIEHLGIDHCFREEIAAAICRIRKEDLEFSSSDDLHVVAVRFRLLRQHGIWVSAEVFDKFRDGNTGSFSASLCSNPRGLLSLYNAAHMAIPGEKALDDAIVFAKRHLQAVTEELRSPLGEQVSRALDIPLPRNSRRVENMHYIAEYEKEEARDATLLELARLDFELVRCLHLEELKEFSLWWSELYSDVKLPYVRDRVAEGYFWTCIIMPEEEHSRARIMFAKAFKLTSLMDDTYDVHATFEESRKFNQAIQRMDASAVSIVPEYLRRLYLRTLTGFQELEDMLEPNERYRMPYFIKAYKQLSEYSLQEVTWANEGHEPSFEEQVRVSTMSAGLPMLFRALLIGSGELLATREVFEWADGEPDMLLASGQIGRFLNDMASYTLGKKDVNNAYQCYMKEFGVTGEEALAVIAGMTEKAWRTINQGCMEIDAAMLPAVQMALVSLARSMEVFYLGGRRDGYTFASPLKDLITSLFLKSIAV